MNVIECKLPERANRRGGNPAFIVSAFTFFSTVTIQRGGGVCLLTLPGLRPIVAGEFPRCEVLGHGAFLGVHSRTCVKRGVIS